MIKIKQTGNIKDKYERLTWDDMQPCSTCKSLECEGAKRIHERDMNIHNTCIDLIEAKTRDEILEIWATKCLWQYGFSNMQFYPVAGESMVILEIVPQNEDDVLAMNQTYYNRLRGISYDEEDEFKSVENSLKIWVKNLKEDILKRFLKKEITKKEYQELEVESIWEIVDQQKKVSQISFRSIVDEELVRIKRGKNLFNEEKLIQDEYKIPDYSGYYKFDPFHFMHRIIASDIARIILDLETGKFIPESKDDHNDPTKPKGGTSFNWRSDPEKELPELFKKMKGVLIAPETTLEQFTAIFTAQPIETIEPVEWIEGTVLLAYLIDQFKNSYQKTPSNKHHWKTGEKCFTHAKNTITSANLRSALDNSYQINKNRKPKDHKLIDDLFDNH